MPIKTVKRIPRVTRDHIAIALVCLSFGAFGAAGTVAIDHLSTATQNATVDAQIAKQISQAVVSGARESCEDFGNPLRKGLREFFTEELRRTENPDPNTLEKFNLTKQEAAEISAGRIEGLKLDVNVRFKDVPCEKQYSLKKGK